MEPHERIIVALDNMSLAQALSVAEALSGKVWGFKIYDFIYGHGPQGVSELRRFGRLFVDAKAYHTPKTVAFLTRYVRDLGADFLSVHAVGGKTMMRAAVRQAEHMKILAETLLTSVSAGGTYITYYAADKDESYSTVSADAGSVVTSLVRDALEEGVHGFILPPNVVMNFSIHTAGRRPLVILPGIRPVWYPVKDDHSVTLTPYEATERGADYVVLGSPITKADDPEAAAQKIADEIALGLRDRGKAPSEPQQSV